MFLCEYNSGFWSSMNGYWMQWMCVNWTRYHSIGLQFHESGEWSHRRWTRYNREWQMRYRAGDKKGYSLSQFTCLRGREERRRTERDTNISCNESIQSKLTMQWTWPCGLRRGSVAARLLGLRLRFPRPGHGCLSLEIVVLSTTSRSLIQRRSIARACVGVSHWVWLNKTILYTNNAWVEGGQIKKQRKKDAKNQWLLLCYVSKWRITLWRDPRFVQVSKVL